MGGHFVKAAAINDFYLSGAARNGRFARHRWPYYRPHHHHIPFNLGAPVGQLAQEIDAPITPSVSCSCSSCMMLALWAPRARYMEANPSFNNDSDGEIFAHGHVGFHFPVSHTGDPIDLILQDFLGQPVFGDTPHQHAAQTG